MWTLKGTFVKKENSEISPETKKKIYGFTIFFNQDAFLKYFVETRDERRMWVKKIAAIEGYVSVKEFYDIKVKIFLLSCINLICRKQLVLVGQVK
jgi:hypothetical protein